MDAREPQYKIHGDRRIKKKRLVRTLEWHIKTFARHVQEDEKKGRNTITANQVDLYVDNVKRRIAVMQFELQEKL